MKVYVSCPYPLEKANDTDVGYDLKSQLTVTFFPGEYYLIPTGCCVKVDEWYDGFGVDIHVRGRSSMALKGFLAHFGTVDEEYNSEIKVVLYYFGKQPYTISEGDKIAQLVFSSFIPVDLDPVESIEENRGGFGSSGI